MRRLAMCKSEYQDDPVIIDFARYVARLLDGATFGTDTRISKTPLAAAAFEFR
jgi:hypothetical protein